MTPRRSETSGVLVDTMTWYQLRQRTTRHDNASAQCRRAGILAPREVLLRLSLNEVVGGGKVAGSARAGVVDLTRAIGSGGLRVRHRQNMNQRRSFFTRLLFVVLLVATGAATQAQDDRGGVLAECAALSPLLDDIHNCLDNYLDVMDDNLADIASYIERSLEAESLTAFAASQDAFATFRRDNCLWYLAFSEPRSEAEQIAKDCLATMSLQRLSELQRLIATNDSDNTTHGGYYVYGASRNTFRPCGSDARYWVEGDAAAVGELQQTYLDKATTDLQVLFVTLKGKLDEEAETTSGHDGVLLVTDLSEVRLPREADCRLPAGGPTSIASATAAELDIKAIDRRAGSDVELTVSEPFTESEVPPVEEPEEQLVAYFGAWLADCSGTGDRRVCRLSTELMRGDTGGSVVVADLASVPMIELSRRADERSGLELRFPGREIDSPARIRWRIDSRNLGDIVASSIRVDESASRQLIAHQGYVREDLLPALLGGAELKVDVLASVDDSSGERFTATLIGLTRALAFADDFVGTVGTR